MSGGRLRSSSGRSPPKAKMAALSWANSGSSRLEQAESTSEAFGFKEGLAAVGRAGGFFWVSLRGRQTGISIKVVIVRRKKMCLLPQEHILWSNDLSI